MEEVLWKAAKNAEALLVGFNLPFCHGWRWKETDRRWEQGEEISILDTFTLEYSPNETENQTTDPGLQRKLHGPAIRAVAKAAGVSTKTHN